MAAWQSGHRYLQKLVDTIQIDTCQHIEEGGWQRGQPLRHVCVGNEADGDGSHDAEPF